MTDFWYIMYTSTSDTLEGSRANRQKELVKYRESLFSFMSEKRWQLGSGAQQRLGQTAVPRAGRRGDSRRRDSGLSQTRPVSDCGLHCTVQL